MKNTNEILTIIEDEFIRLINLYNNWHDRSTDFPRILELMFLCREMEIPIDWEWDEEIIQAITISGKRIEFENYTRCRKVTEVQDDKSN